MAKRSYSRRVYKDAKVGRKWKQTSRDFRYYLSGAGGGRGSDLSRGLYGDSYTVANPGQKWNRKLARFRGAGDYYSEHMKPFLQKWIPQGTLSALGGAAGGMLGSAGLGSAMGGAASRYLGWGDYGATSTNSIMGDGSGSNQQISVNASSDLSGDIEFAHTEFVQNITVTAAAVGNTSFAIQSFSINPAIDSLFPFLSQLAANFTLYEFEGLMFHYKPTSGEFGSAGSNSLGKVIFATNYDPDAVNFTSSQQMENYDYANSTKPSCAMIHGVETKPASRSTIQLYTRTGVSQKDKVFTDLGLFQVATEGIYASAAGTQVIGELWVTYKVKLSRKNLQANVLASNVPFASNALTFNTGNTWNSITLTTSPATLSTLWPWQTGVLPVAVSTLPTALVPNGGVAQNQTGSSNLLFAFPQSIINGTYLFTIGYNNASEIDVLTFGSSPLGCTIQKNLNGFLVAPINETAATTQGVLQGLIIVNAPGSIQAQFAVVFSTTLTAGSGGINYNITQVNAVCAN